MSCKNECQEILSGSVKISDTVVFHLCTMSAKSVFLESCTASMFKLFTVDIRPGVWICYIMGYMR